jgi:hypothetical protein
VFSTGSSRLAKAKRFELGMNNLFVFQMRSR